MVCTNESNIRSIFITAMNYNNNNNEESITILSFRFVQKINFKKNSIRHCRISDNYSQQIEAQQLYQSIS